MEPSTLLAIGLIILAPVDGEIKVLWTKKEIPAAECREQVLEQALKFKDQYERVSGLCYTMPPVKPAAPTFKGLVI
jgi:hypothetical protein